MTNQHDQFIPASVSQHVDQGASEASVDDGAPQQGRRKVGLLEALVSLSLLVSLAGVTMPMIASNRAEGRLEQAVFDMQTIVDGIRDYSGDTLFLPTGDRGRTNVDWLYGPGELPQNMNIGSVSRTRSLDDILANDSMGGSEWSGPYGNSTADPWGNAYLVNVLGLINPTVPTWVLTAGPDGVVQTPNDALKASGDDLILPIN